MNNHGILLLDEPTNALDPNGVELFKQQLCSAKKRGAILIVASHDIVGFARLLRCRLHDGRRQNNGKGGGREMRGRHVAIVGVLVAVSLLIVVRIGIVNACAVETDYPIEHRQVGEWIDLDGVFFGTAAEDYSGYSIKS